MDNTPRDRWNSRQTNRQRNKAHAVRVQREACYLEVVRRAKGHCERCGIPISTRRPKWHPQRAHMNHKVPLSKGGADTPENCELLCQACHMPGGQHAPTPERLLQTLQRDPKGLW